MVRKQTDYLADILAESAEVAAHAPTEAPNGRTRPNTLLTRESALARAQSGEVRHVTQLLLDPARVRVWSGNARLYSHLNDENCRELIDSIVAEGGQKVPAVVRRITDDPDHDYEVVAGTRRHWSISWLRKNAYSDMQFLAHVAQLDDEAAFRLADLENRARQDVSDIERARNYADALKRHYGGKQKRMAERLRVSEGWLSKMLHVAEIPDGILSAFSSIFDVQLKPAYALAKAMDDKSATQAMLSEALDLMEQQASARRSGMPPIPAKEVIKRLMDATKQENDKAQADNPVYLSRFGRTALSVQSVNRQGVTVRLHSGSGADNVELAAALRDILDQLEATGRGLKQ